MLKRMKKIYDVEFHSIRKDNVFFVEVSEIEERNYYYFDINANESLLRHNVLLRSRFSSNLRRLEVIYNYGIKWEDDGLGLVVILKNDPINHFMSKDKYGTIAKVDEDKYFLLLKRMNFYA